MTCTIRFFTLAFATLFLFSSMAAAVPGSMDGYNVLAMLSQCRIIESPSSPSVPAFENAAHQTHQIPEAASGGHAASIGQGTTSGDGKPKSKKAAGGASSPKRRGHDLERRAPFRGRKCGTVNDEV
ncbi:hypothetical protein BKA70DRAFT_1238288 [Coprinopsis sp. MPI-PUGE-AT-0042]|nr:hypothetical protein BKA70DRAFT_1238288 [Coprinopsis sp. MPI-PUGE-AT-0042]